MAAINNTFKTGDAKGIREDLSDLISNISPEETPFTDMIGKRKVTQTRWDWQTDSLAASDTTNAQAEGDDITTFAAVTPTVRLYNNQQISRKEIIISDTMEEVDAAGRKSEIAYQTAKKGAELKLDVETIALYNQAASGTDPRKTGAILAWLKSNVDKGAAGANPSYTDTPNATRSDTTQRTFTEAMLKAVIKSCWDNGGKPRVIMVGSYNKQLISSTFTGRATTTVNADAKSPTFVQGAVDVYVSDFGNMKIVANRNQRARDVLVLDTTKWKLAYLRPYARVKLAKTGDAEKMFIRAEWGLQSDNEKASGLIADTATS